MRQSYTTATAAAAAVAGDVRNAPRGGRDGFRRLETGSLMTPPWNSERKRQNEPRYAEAAFNPP